METRLIQAPLDPFRKEGPKIQAPHNHFRSIFKLKMQIAVTRGMPRRHSYKDSEVMMTTENAANHYC